MRRTLASLLLVWTSAGQSSAQQPDQRLALLRAWVAQNESRQHDFVYTSHRFVSVRSPQGNYPKFNGLTLQSYWLHNRNCVSNIVWDDPGGPEPLLDADGCLPQASPYLNPISLNQIVKTRMPSSITPIVLTSGKPGLRFLFPPVAPNARATYEQNCSAGAELEVFADAATYAFVRTEVTVRTADCEKKNLPLGVRGVDDYKTYPDNFTTSVHAVLTGPPLPPNKVLLSKTTLGREYKFKQPLPNAVAIADTTLVHLERQTDIQINPISHLNPNQEERRP